MAKPSPFESLRAELALKRRTLPMFLRPQLGDVIDKLDDWIGSTEQRLAAQDARLRALDKMPSAESLDTLTRGLPVHA
jgi:hypothetical protein